MKFTLAQSTKQDFLKKLEFDNKLNTYLGKNTKLSKMEIKSLYNYYVKLHNLIDEYIIFCENDENEIVGYIHIGTYVIDKGIRLEDVGNLIGIYVDENSRGGSFIAFDLLKNGLALLRQNGINKAYMNVQTHNKFRFLHYAISDEVVASETYTRKNGTITTNKLLAINDIAKLQEKPLKDIMRDVRKYRLQFEKEGKEREV